MDDKTLRKVQNQLLIIAKEIKRVCEENGIRYFLVGGTLIGAVRHKGFIPWDDDLDIGMLREDYEKFLRIAPSKMNKEFFLQTWNTDDEYGHAFAKVRMNDTVYREANDPCVKKNQGFWVDIFPYDNIPDDAKERVSFSRRIMICRLSMHIKGHIKPWNNAHNMKKKIKLLRIYIPFIIISLFTKRKVLIDLYSSLMTKYNNTNTLCVHQQSGGAKFGKYPIKKQYLESFVNLPFEDDFFSCPALYDSFLSDIYGDYMKYPPKEQQKCTHGIIEIRFKEN